MSIQDIKDRVPSIALSNGAIRYGIYDENGSLIRYEYIKREDAPIEEGTAINKKMINNLQGDLYTADRYLTPSVGDGVAQSFTGDYWYTNSYETLTLQSVTTSTSYSITNLFKMNADYQCYIDGTSGKTGSFVIKNEKKIKILQIGMKGGFSSTDNRNPKSFRIYGSNDNSQWTQIYSNTREIKSNLVTLNVNSADFYQYIKFEFTFATGSVWFYRLYISSCEYKNFVFNVNLPLTSYEKGKIININCPKDIKTGGAINVNGLGEKKFDGQMIQGKNYTLAYDGNQFSIVDNPWYSSWNIGTAKASFSITGINKRIKVGQMFGLVFTGGINPNANINIKLNSGVIYNGRFRSEYYVKVICYYAPNGFLYVDSLYNGTLTNYAFNFDGNIQSIVASSVQSDYTLNSTFTAYLFIEEV